MPRNLIFGHVSSRVAIASVLAAPTVLGSTLLFPTAASAQSVCTTLPGGTATCVPALPAPAPVPGLPPIIGGIDVTGSPTPLDLTLADGFASNGPINLGTVGAADILLDSAGTSSINSAGPALTANSGRDLTAEVTNITTAGDGATGAALTAVDNLIFTSDGLVSTTGANADGITATGRTVTLNLNDVRTQGPNAQGVETFSTGGPTNLTFDTIETNGGLSDATVLRGSGDNNLSGRALTTNDTNAVAFDIQNDAAACILLGNGGCDNTVRVDQITTNGFGGVGGLVSATGDTNINVGILRTSGGEAAGLSLSNDPDACVALGVGACDTAFTVNDLSTGGVNSPGALVRGAGDIDANVGVLRTGGDQAAGLDLASNPQACAVLGAGACDTSFSAGQLTTNGAGSTGALVRSAGDTNGNVGVLRTGGNDAAGIDIASNPTACAVVGVGGCDVNLRAADVGTRGNNAAGVLINTPGQIVANLGLVTTGGNGSTGLGIVQDPAACVAVGPGACGTNARVDRAETGRSNSRGIDIRSPGPVVLDTGTVITRGPTSDAINVATSTGPITIASGPINAGGTGSNGIVAQAAACADVSVAARDDVVSADATAILASSACGVRVSTLPGASVSGRTAGIDVTSGTGATITIGDTVAATAGPAIDADGGATAIVVAATGVVNGRIDLTGSGDTLTNNGQLNLLGTSDFGLEIDLLTNNATVQVDGTAELAGLERFVNAGLVQLADGAADDRLTICGDFVGTSGQLSLDVQRDLLTADRLVVCGNASGTTTLVPNFLGGATGTVNPNGVILVDAGSLTPGAFTLGGQSQVGFVDYSLREAGSDVLLVGVPNDLALEPLLLGGIGLDYWYQSADAWSEAAAARRNGAGSGASFWVQGYASTEDRGEGNRTVDVFGTSRAANLKYETDRIGAQGGVNFGAGPVFGVTGGYQRARVDFASGTQAVLGGYNVGAYALFGGPQGLYAELLAKADFFDVKLENSTLFAADPTDGRSYGAEGELGWRFAWGGAAVDVGAGLAYVRSELDAIDVDGGRFEFDEMESLRGRAGVRITGRGRSFAPFADVKVLHEFLEGSDARFTSGGFDLPLSDAGMGTSVRGEFGFSRRDAGPGGFASLWGQLGDVKGYGVRVGLRF